MWLWSNRRRYLSWSLSDSSNGLHPRPLNVKLPLIWFGTDHHRFALFSLHFLQLWRHRWRLVLLFWDYQRRLVSVGIYFQFSLSPLIRNSPAIHVNWVSQQQRLRQNRRRKLTGREMNDEFVSGWGGLKRKLFYVRSHVIIHNKNYFYRKD